MAMEVDSTMAPVERRRWPGAQADDGYYTYNERVAFSKGNEACARLAWAQALPETAEARLRGRGTKRGNLMNPKEVFDELCRVASSANFLDLFEIK